MLEEHIKDQGSLHQLAKPLDHFYLPSHCPVNHNHQIPRQKCLHSPSSLYAEFGTRDFDCYYEHLTGGVSSMWRKLQAEGNDFCNVLPELHAFTGCDTTSAFDRKGKTTHLLIGLSLISLIFLSLGRSSDMPHHTWSISCVCFTIGIQPLRQWSHERFASSKVCRQIHPKTRKGTLNFNNGVGISAFYHNLPTCRNALNMHEGANYQPIILPLI